MSGPTQGKSYGSCIPSTSHSWTPEKIDRPAVNQVLIKRRICEQHIYFELQRQPAGRPGMPQVVTDEYCSWMEARVSC